jgi:hypothetical protein
MLRGPQGGQYATVCGATQGLQDTRRWRMKDRPGVRWERGGSKREGQEQDQESKLVLWVLNGVE